MNEVKNINSVQQYNDYFGVETIHSLVCVIDGSKAKPLRFCKKRYEVYAIVLKDGNCGSLKYGRSIYDYQRGAMLFLAPGQVMGSEDDGKLHQPEGWALAFHPELLRNTPLAKIMKDYTFFSYAANEALHLSEHERQMIVSCIEKIQAELQHPIDKHSKTLIVDNIKLFLDYCERFYDRQFTTRKNENHDILVRLEKLLDDYFISDTPVKDGMLSVQYCAERLCLSANYLSDLLKKETGLSALKHIQQKTIEVAKERISNKSKTISEISYELGFPYPQHFSRWFKKMAGCTPNEYKGQIY